MFAFYLDSDYDVISDETYFSMGLTQFNILDGNTKTKGVKLLNWTANRFPDITIKNFYKYNFINIFDLTSILSKFTYILLRLKINLSFDVSV